MAICSLCLLNKFFQICNLEVLNQGVVAMSETENSDFPRENFNNISESDVRCSSFSAEHQDVNCVLNDSIMKVM